MTITRKHPRRRNTWYNLPHAVHNRVTGDFRGLTGDSSGGAINEMQRLTGKKKQAADALLSGAGVTDAAAAAGVSRVSLWRWVKDDPAFGDALRSGTDAALTTAARRLKVSTDDAVSTLLDVMNTGGGHGAMARLRAADLVLTHAARLTEMLDIMARLDALEARQ